MESSDRQATMSKWEAIIHQAEGSGMSIRPWCIANDVRVSQYYYWHRELVLAGRIPGRRSKESKGKSFPAPMTKVTTPVFAEVTLESPAHNDSQISDMESSLAQSQIMIERNHCKIFIGEDFSSTTLKRVLEVIGNAS